MTDIVQNKPNEFFLLHSHPTKTFRKVKGVNIEKIDLQDKTMRVMCCVADKRMCSVHLHDRDGSHRSVVKRVSLKTKQVVSTTPLACSQCGKGDKYTVWQVLTNNDRTVISSQCGYCQDSLILQRSGKQDIVLNKGGIYTISRMNNRAYVMLVEGVGFHIYYWKDIEKENYSPLIIREFQIRSENDNNYITDYFLEKKGLSILWRKGYLKTTSMSTPDKIEGGHNVKWKSFVLADRRKYLLTGIEKTSSHPEIILKLVDISNKTIDTVSFVSPLEKDVEINRMIALRPRVVLAVNFNRYVHLFQVIGKRIQKVFVNKIGRAHV